MTKHRSVLGVLEVAELLNVERKTPHAWIRRGLFPEPDHDEINGSPAWNRETIISWAARTGRLPDDLADEAAMLGVRVNHKRGGSK